MERWFRTGAGPGINIDGMVGGAGVGCLHFVMGLAIVVLVGVLFWWMF